MANAITDFLHRKKEDTRVRVEERTPRELSMTPRELALKTDDI